MKNDYYLEDYTIYKQLQYQKQLEERQKHRERIQDKFNFKIPEYILDELIEIEGNTEKSKKELNMWIGLAIVAGSISKENGQRLREYDIVEKK